MIDSLGKALSTLACALFVSGCAATSPASNTLFEEDVPLGLGHSPQGSILSDDGGCSYHKPCDRTDLLFAVVVGDKSAGYRLQLGPEAKVIEIDEQAHLKAAFIRHAGGPIQIVLERVFVDEQNRSPAMAFADQADTLTIPANGDYPAVRARWKPVTAVARTMETWSETPGSLIHVLLGEEMP